MLVGAIVVSRTNENECIVVLDDGSEAICFNPMNFALSDGQRLRFDPDGFGGKNVIVLASAEPIYVFPHLTPFD